MANGLGDPILSYLSATDKITDEQALAGQLVLALSGKVNTKTINEIKQFLTKQIKKTGKNPKQIAQELKEEIAKVSGKSVDDVIDIPIRYQVSIPKNAFKIIAKDEMLSPNIIKSFMDNFYYTIETLQELKVFRRFGGDDINKAKLLGGYTSTEALLSRQDLALLRKWNTMRFEAEIFIEKGTKLNVGKVAQYGKYSGGADQILLPINYSENWIKKIKDLKTGKEYSLEEFKKIFPEQVKR